MGNNFMGFCGQDLKVNSLIDMFKIANKLSFDDEKYESLLTNHQDRLRKLIRDRKLAKEIIDGVQVEVIPYSRDPSQNLAELIEQEIKLVVSANFDPTYTVLDSKQKRLTYDGYIIFCNAYYFGELLNGKANGKGKLYLQEIHSYEVVGYWIHDSLKNGKVYEITSNHGSRIQTDIFEIELLNGQEQAIIKVKNKFIYEGSISLIGSNKFEDILTGKGVVKYQNGDKYEGQLVKGVYQTGEGRTASFKYASGECKSFKGSYKSGLREDIGVFQLDIEGQRLTLHTTFKQGIPLERGLIRLQNGIQYPVNITNEGLFVQSRIQFG